MQYFQLPPTIQPYNYTILTGLGSLLCRYDILTTYTISTTCTMDVGLTIDNTVLYYLWSYLYKLVDCLESIFNREVSA